MPLIVEDIKLYSVKELSEMLNVSKVAILGYIKDGRLKAQKLGGKWAIASDNLKEFLTGNYKKPAEKKKRRLSLRGIIKDGQVDNTTLKVQDLAEKGFIGLATGSKVKVDIPPKFPGKPLSEYLKEIRE